MTRRWICLAACLAALPAVAQTGEAQTGETQTGVVLTGVEAGSATHSAYLGAVLPLPGSTLGKGWVQRYWLDYTAYRYEKTARVDIDAKVAGLEAALGWQGSAGADWWAAYVGARYGHTRLTPDDPANEDRGGKLGLKLQLEGETALSSAWRLNGVASHRVGQSDYWLRLRAQTGLGQLRLGPELVVQGDPVYRIVKLGVHVGGIPLGRDAVLTVKAGASKLNSDPLGAYAGLEGYFPF
jgi:hypothetical protein